MKIDDNVSQPRRLVYLIIYLIFFMFISLYLFGNLFPPLSNKGFWFYTGLISLVIGSQLVTPFFTNPANGLSYATVGLIATLFTKPHEITLGYQMVIIICGIIILASLLSIATMKIKGDSFQKFSSSSKILVENFGNPRFLYIMLIIYSVSQFHTDSPHELIWIIIAGFISFAQLAERFDSTIIKILNQWKLKKSLTFVGKIEAYQTPNIILIRLEDKLTVKKDSLLLIKDPTFGLKLGFNLGYMGRDESILLRVLELVGNSLGKDDLDFYNKFVQDNEVLIVSDDLKNKLSETNDLITKANSFLGIIDTESTIGNISIELINEREIVEGSLLEVKIKGVNVLYQILDGLTWEDIVLQKNKYGYSKVKARKIGTWNESNKKFEVVGWMPSLNTPVFIKQKDEVDIPIESIGTFPGTNYYISIKDFNHLVTHNTAILGILGVGKSFLAFELVERMISQKIKVIVIDLTNQYQEKLAGFFHPEQLLKNNSEIEKACVNGRDNIQKIKEDGGTIRNFKTVIKDQLKLFLKYESHPYLTIYNPLKFDVWKQTGGIYTAGKEVLATMVSLTPCEITQIITEVTLELCQEKGMTDYARVCIVFEEAHTLIPENNSVVGENDKNASAGTSRATLQGRKYGLGCLLITQRTANVTKTILNQCNTIFALRNFDETGKTFLANYFGDDYSKILSNIPEQQAIVFGKASSCENPVLIQINKRDKFLEIFRASNPLPNLPKWNDGLENDLVENQHNDGTDTKNENDLTY